MSLPAPAPTPLEPSRTQHCRLTLDSWTEQGLARGTLVEPVDDLLPAGAVLDVLGGIPGEEVEVELRWTAIWTARQRRHRKPPTVRLVRVLRAAPERVTPLCPVFGDCGGCRLQHLPYASQLRWKQTKVADALAAVGLDPTLVLPPIGMDDPWHFRNQMRFAVDREGRPGLTALGTHRVIPIDSCPIAHPLIDTTFAILRQAVNPRPQVMIRCGAGTGEVLVQPTPGEAQREALSAVGITPREHDLHEKLGGLTFAMRPSSFFQTNSAQAEVMADLVLRHIPTGPATLVVDAYCGVGTFAALLARTAGRVLAIEESASAVRDARENLAALGLAQVEVLQGKTEALLPEIVGHIDAVVLDPPRMGCMPDVIAALIARRVARIVYVSCDPQTLARDLAAFQPTYRTVSVQPLDMFPQTYHIECVAVLDLDLSSSPAK